MCVPLVNVNDNTACSSFLADRTNDRAYATVLRPSVVVCHRRRRRL